MAYPNGGGYGNRGGNGGYNRGGNGGGGGQIVTGTVDQVNDGGFKMNGQWFNYSKQRDFTEFAEAGDYVEINVSQGKWINEITITPGNGGAPAPRQQAQAPRQGSGYQGGASRPAAGVDDKVRQVLIVRQSSAATAFKYAANAGLGVDEALDIARQIEAYVFDGFRKGEAPKPAPAPIQEPPAGQPDNDDLDELPF